MNILPKKKWHVRTKENIARVRKDEAEAAEREKERCRRVALAEQEHRTAILRNRSASHLPSTSSLPSSLPSTTTSTLPSSSLTSSTSTGHVNFFQELEDGAPVPAANQERIQEQREEQRLLEKKMGLSNCLSDVIVDVPWYAKGRSNHNRKLKQQQPEMEPEVKRNARDDPLTLFSQCLERSDEVSRRSDVKQNTSTGSLPTSKTFDRDVTPKIRNSRSKRKHKKSDHRQKKKRRRRYSSSSSSSSEGSSAEDRERRRIALERMREERLVREKEERARAERLLSKNKESIAEPEQQQKQEESRPRQKYNSQFNPHLSRQNRSA